GPDLFKEWQPIPGVVEITTKAGTDFSINRDIILAANLMSGDEYDYLIGVFVKATDIIAAEATKMGFELADIKLEFGCYIDEFDNKIWVVIDEIGPGNMRGGSRPIYDENDNSIMIEDGKALPKADWVVMGSNYIAAQASEAE
ncbi:MAG: hypothetical protein LBG64_03190, partial [Pseudomonadales bacterium]|nr:hypothetical protein [Pseudomonadales bacterium]